MWMIWEQSTGIYFTNCSSCLRFPAFTLPAVWHWDAALPHIAAIAEAGAFFSPGVGLDWYKAKLGNVQAIADEWRWGCKKCFWRWYWLFFVTLACSCRPTELVNTQFHISCNVFSTRIWSLEGNGRKAAFLPISPQTEMAPLRSPTRCLACMF